MTRPEERELTNIRDRLRQMADYSHGPHEQAALLREAIDTIDVTLEVSRRGRKAARAHPTEAQND